MFCLSSLCAAAAVLAATQTAAADVHSIEIVGGGVRVPAIRETISTFFGKSLSTTLNGDEAVARGCALQVSVRRMWVDRCVLAQFRVSLILGM